MKDLETGRLRFPTQVISEDGNGGAVNVITAHGLKGDPGVGIPTGGLPGQIPVKLSTTDFDFDWQTPVGAGDMLVAVYDVDNNGRVDAAETLNDGLVSVTAAEMRTHLDDVTLHRVINDLGTGAEDLWSAQQIITAVAAKADVIHTHDAADIVSGQLDDARISASSVTQHLGTIDALTLLNAPAEAGADVTDTANVTAAGAVMDSEVDLDIKTLALPPNTTISPFGATLVDDPTAAAARATLGVDPAGTDNSTDVTLLGAPGYLSLAGQALTASPIDLTADVTGILPPANISLGSIDTLSDVNTTAPPPAIGQNLTWNGGAWVPGQAITIDNTFVVTTLIDRDNLTTQNAGDIAVVLDEDTTFVWNGTAWVEVLAPASVVTVNGQSGIVALAVGNLTDVDTTTTLPAIGQTLVWDGTNFVPGIPSAAGSINDLVDVDIVTTPPAVGETMIWNGTSFVPGVASTVGSVDDLSDVDTTTAAPTIGQVLTWDGANWIPVTTPRTDIYAADGTLNASRTIDMDGFDVTFSGAQSVVIADDGEIQATAYLNTRDDTATAPPASYLYTDLLGNVKSAPLPAPNSSLIGFVGSFVWKDAQEPVAHMFAMNGQTIANGALVYPSLAAKYPAWVSGNDIDLPDWSDLFIRNVGAEAAQAIQAAGTALPIIPFETDNPGDHSHGISKSGGDGTTTLRGGGAVVATNEDGVMLAGDHNHFVNQGGDAETRPVNVSLVLCVVAQAAVVGELPVSIDALIDADTATTPPLPGQSLVWDGTNWVPGAASAGPIDGLTDVDTTTVVPVAGQLLSFDGTNWVPGSSAVGPIDDLTDVDTTTIAPVAGQLLSFDGTNWVPGASVGPIDDLTDVDTTTVVPVAGQTLSFDGTNWIPSAALTIDNTFVVNTIVQRDAITTQNPGDVAVVTDINTTYVWDGGAWVQVLTPAQVISVNTQTGIVNLAVGNLTDVDTTTVAPVVGNRLEWDGTNWVPALHNINALTDVDTVTVPPTIGQGIAWDGASWRPGTVNTFYRVDGTLLSNRIINTAGFNLTIDGTEDFVFNDDGSLQITAYPETRDDTATTAPTNYLYTDATGNVLSAPIVAPPPNSFKQVFNATTDWGAASGGMYTITIAAATHAIADPDTVQVWEDVAGRFILTTPETTGIETNGDITIEVRSAPDNRFAGRVVIR